MWHAINSQPPHTAATSCCCCCCWWHPKLSHHSNDAHDDNDDDAVAPCVLLQVASCCCRCRLAAKHLTSSAVQLAKLARCGMPPRKCTLGVQLAAPTSTSTWGNFSSVCGAVLCQRERALSALICGKQNVAAATRVATATAAAAEI